MALSGTLFGTSATFTGSISAASATFTGAITGTDATFSGSVTAWGSMSTAGVNVLAPNAAAAAPVVGWVNGKVRWGVYLANGEAESTGNAGSNFQINRFADGGAYLGTPLSINRASGYVSLANSLGVTGNVNSASWTYSGDNGFALSATSGERYLSFAGNWYLGWNTSSGAFRFVGIVSGTPTQLYSLDAAGSGVFRSNLTVGNSVYAMTAGQYYFLYGNCGLYSDANYLMYGDSGTPSAATSWRYYYTKATGQRNWVNSAGNNVFQISPGGACICPGGFSTASDASMKRDIEPAPIGLAELRKITPSYFHRIHDEPPEDQPGWRQPDRREFGFIAQDVQAALPDAVITVEHKAPGMPEGTKDINNPDNMEVKESKYLAIEIMPMLAALTNAVKELDKRLATIEAKR